jgi:hypothetical protein
VTTLARRTRIDPRCLPVFLWVTAGASVLFWVLGSGGPGGVVALPAGLPASALMFLVPAAGAGLAVARFGGPGSVRWLARRVVDPGSLRTPAPWVLVASTMPLLVVGATLLSGDGGNRGADREPLAALPVLAAVFLVTAAAEEAGWTAIATDVMRDQVGSVRVGLVLGSLWAVLHAVPYAQAGHPPSWVAGQCAFTVVLRVGLVRVYDLTGGPFGGILPVVVVHASFNLAWALTPAYDPWVMTLSTAAAVWIVAASSDQRRRSGR